MYVQIREFMWIPINYRPECRFPPKSEIMEPPSAVNCSVSLRKLAPNMASKFTHARLNRSGSVSILGKMSKEAYTVNGEVTFDLSIGIRLLFWDGAPRRGIC